MPRTAAGNPGEGAMHVAELRAALSSSIVQTRYQPIIRIRDRRPVALEALVRLDHPEHGTMMPDRFVPQMEDAGLAHELTGLVSARALDDMAGRLLAGRNLSLSLNFPLDVILQSSALDLLEAQRVASGIPAGKIIVELTESRPVEDFEGLGVSVSRLRQMGYHVAIDDVGPAVPRLAPLLKLPFNGLKLDKGMMLDACTDDAARNFLAVTVQQAHAAGLTVVAEGVETLEIWNLAVALGADMAQGFLVARPLPVAAVPIWLDGWDAASLPDA